MYVLYSLHYVQFIVFNALYSMHAFDAFYSIHCILCIVFHALFSLHFNLSIFVWVVCYAFLYELYAMHCYEYKVFYAFDFLHFNICIWILLYAKGLMQIVPCILFHQLSSMHILPIPNHSVHVILNILLSLSHSMHCILCISLYASIDAFHSMHLVLRISFYTSCSKYLISSISFCAHFSMHLNLCNYSMHLILCISSVRLNLCILFYASFSMHSIL